MNGKLHLPPFFSAMSLPWPPSTPTPSPSTTIRRERVSQTCYVLADHRTSACTQSERPKREKWEREREREREMFANLSRRRRGSYLCELTCIHGAPVSYCTVTDRHTRAHTDRKTESEIVGVCCGWVRLWRWVVWCYRWWKSGRGRCRLRRLRSSRLGGGG